MLDIDGQMMLSKKDRSSKVEVGFDQRIIYS